jgi:hypothetical protein
VGQPTQFSAGVRLWHSLGKVNLKRHVVGKDGKEHVYYSLNETIRINNFPGAATSTRVRKSAAVTNGKMDQLEGCSALDRFSSNQAR